MWQKIEDWIIQYCLGVMAVLFAIIERAHPAVSIGLPLLVTAAAQWFLPRWVSMALAVLIWIPSAAAMALLLVSCWPHLHRNRDYK